MTLEEAIKHCEDRAKADCSECAAEHRQLAEWLKELKSKRECVRELSKSMGNNTQFEQGFHFALDEIRNYGGRQL